MQKHFIKGKGCAHLSLSERSDFRAENRSAGAEAEFFLSIPPFIPPIFSYLPFLLGCLSLSKADILKNKTDRSHAPM